ncbi:MAG: SprB repeat-containing protein [Bacteroidetes bacterium]|nr:SprB repeat-containing protein [Bacteroidota bacterium]
MYGTSVNAQSLSLSLASSNYNGYNISCFGGRDGSINLTVTGGHPPYNYEWSDGNGTEDLIDLAAGYYQVLVTDAGNNAAEIGITLREPEAVGVDFIISSYPNGYNVSCYNCFNGSIINLPSGGVAPYTYNWEDGPTTQDRFNLGKGTYALQITDANQCLLSPEQYYLFEPERSDWTMNGNTGSNPTAHFIGTTDNKDVVFKTNNTERLRILAGGDIKLNAFTGNGDKFLAADAVGKIIVAPCDPWVECGNTIATSNYFGTKNNEPINFKVFTDSPLHQDPVLTLTTYKKISIYEFKNSPFGFLYTDNLGDIYKEDYNGDPTTFLNGTGVFSGLPSSASAWQLNGNNVFNTTSLIGIGTVSPGSILDIRHNTAQGLANGMILSNKATGNFNSEIKFNHFNGTQDDLLWAIGTDITHTGQGDFFIYDQDVNPQHTGATRFIINDQGYIGIGTINPTEKLNVLDGSIYLQGETQGLIVDDQTNKRIGLIKYSGREAGIWRTANQRFEIGRVNTTSLPGNPSTGDFTTDVYIDGNGKVGIGVIPSPNSLYRLFVEDGIVTRDVLVTNAQTFPDFVFEEGYELRTLYELEAFIEKNKHLPDFPSADEVSRSEGFAVGRMQVELLKTVEELTLYVIALKKEIDALKANNQEIHK